MYTQHSDKHNIRTVLNKTVFNHLTFVIIANKCLHFTDIYGVLLEFSEL